MIHEAHDDFEYTFPAIRGIQAGREYFVSMCPLKLIPRIFLFDDEELAPELRAQRSLNLKRVPEMARYVYENPAGYVFSALTASIDGPVRFQPHENGTPESHVGLLHVPMTARFIINDGQHRRAAIEAALRESPHLASETIAVVFFVDPGLKRCQQMFADLNRYAVRPSKSLGVLYDHRDEDAEIARLIVLQSPVFKGVVEMEKSTLSRRSRKLFTMSSLHAATKALLAGLDLGTLKRRAETAKEFWEEVATHFPEWEQVRERKLTAGEVRTDFIHTHGIALQAIGRAGNSMFHGALKDWRTRLRGLESIDWSRSNADLWEGRALIGGRVSKSNRSITLTCNVVKKALRIPLDEREKNEEESLSQGATRESKS